MRTDEVMRCDWLLLYGKPVKVKGCMEHMIYIQLEAGKACDAFSRFEPIPITHEILVANGFVYDGGEIYNYDWSETRTNEGEEGVYSYSIAFRKFYNMNGEWDGSLGFLIAGEVTVIHCVHELQHMLKLVGLKGKATRFKV